MQLNNSAKLVHDFNRLYSRFRHPDQFKRLQRLRKKETRSGISLKPFDKHKCIFVRIPKCAGQSVSKSLFANLAGSHRTIQDYQLAFTSTEFGDYFKFTIVRNPWDRLVSAFFFLKKGGIDEEDLQFSKNHLLRYPDFHSFVEKGLFKDDIRDWVHFVPQHKFVCLRNLTLGVDFVGRFENLEKDFSKIADILNIQATLAKINVTNSRKKNFASNYTNRTIDIVSEVYREDIKLFEYRFNDTSD